MEILVSMDPYMYKYNRMYVDQNSLLKKGQAFQSTKAYLQNFINQTGNFEDDHCFSNYTMKL